MGLPWLHLLFHSTKNSSLETNSHRPASTVMKATRNPARIQPNIAPAHPEWPEASKSDPNTCEWWWGWWWNWDEDGCEYDGQRTRWLIPGDFSDNYHNWDDDVETQIWRCWTWQWWPGWPGQRWSCWWQSQLHGMVDDDEGGGVGNGEDAGPHQVRGKVKAAEEKANHKISRTDWLPPIHPCFTFGQSNSSSHKVPRVSPDFWHFFRHFLESLRALFTKFLETWCHLISDWTADEVCWLLSH